MVITQERYLDLIKLGLIDPDMIYDDCQLRFIDEREKTDRFNTSEARWESIKARVDFNESRLDDLFKALKRVTL